MWLRSFNLFLCQQSKPSKLGELHGQAESFACTCRDSGAAWASGAEVEEDYVSAPADL